MYQYFSNKIAMQNVAQLSEFIHIIKTTCNIKYTQYNKSFFVKLFIMVHGVNVLTYNFNFSKKKKVGMFMIAAFDVK